MTTIADLPYHFGLKVAFHPDKHQQKIIHHNSNIARQTYNLYLECDQHLYQLQKLDVQHLRHNPDYDKVFNYLVHEKQVSPEFAAFMIDPNHKLLLDRHHQTYISQKTLRKLKATKLFKPEPISSTGMQITDQEKAYYEGLKASVKNIRNSHPYYNHADTDSCCISQARQSYNAAWNMYRKVHQAGTPKFKARSYEDVYQTSNHYGKQHHDDGNLLNGNIRFLDQHHLLLPKLGVCYVNHMREQIWQQREQIRLGTVTIRKDERNHYYISLQLGSEQPFVPSAKTHHKPRIVGIDVNLENFLTTSDRQVIDNPRFYQNTLPRLRKLQKRVSRRYEQSKHLIASRFANPDDPNPKANHHALNNRSNYQKACLQLARVYRKIMNQRNSFADKISTELVQQYDVLVVEKIRGKNLLRDHAIAQKISDVGWRIFLQKLAYKAELYGKTYLEVSPNYTTQTCHDCGYVCGSDERHAKLTLKDRQWTCPACGKHHIRDINAALNIRDRADLSDLKA